MTLTKDRIIDSIYHSTDLQKDRSAEIFRSLIEIIKQALESGEDLLISGFGKFVVGRGTFFTNYTNSLSSRKRPFGIQGLKRKIIAAQPKEIMVVNRHFR